MADNPIATWTVELNVDCPCCGKGFNIWDRPIIHGIDDLEIGENKDNFEAACPKCGHEFKCDVMY